MKAVLRRFFKDERGLEASEYALLLALICVALVAAIYGLRVAVEGAFTGATNAMESTATTGSTT